MDLMETCERFEQNFDNKPWFDDLDRKGEIIMATTEPVRIFTAMGGAVKRVVKPGRQVGTVLGTNKAGNWYYIKDLYNQDGPTAFVSANEKISFVKPDPNFKGLTDQQKKDVALSAISAGSPGGAALATTYKAGEAVVNALPDFGTVVKVIIGILILVLLVLIFRR